MDLLEIKGLCKKYDNREKSVFSDFNFSMKQGDFIALMGPSGSGKTTLLNLVSAIEKVDQGKIQLEGQEISDFGIQERTLYRRRKIGMVFQDFHLLDSLNLHDNIILPMTLWEKDMERIEERFLEVTKIAGISELGERYPMEVSGGERQRAAICRALMNEPKLLLADEPTGNLDRKTARSIMEYFQTIYKKSSILMVTHDAYAASFSKRVLFLEDGIIVKELQRTGTRKEFFVTILTAMTEREVEE
ncbi:ABC transporter, ATP-binding protein [Lachnospiraceae bacterium KM106-2]|nr:ABC transporter, ATP-binding protein [Lachnospiraceae bacterium KM106-2]